MHLSRSAPSTTPGSLPPVSSNRLFLSASHREVLAALAHAFAGPPCIAAVTGDAGLGKTTLVTEAVVGWPGHVRFVRGALFTIEADLAGLASAVPTSPPPILVIDDAHEMGAAAFGQLAAAAIRVTRPHVVLVGRTEFWHRARDPAFGVDNLVAHRSVLFPMPYAEAENYLDHVFRMAGCPARRVLDEKVRHDLLMRAQGNMRRLNLELSNSLSRTTWRGNLMARRRPRRSWRRVLQSAIACALGGIAVALAGLLVVAPEQFAAWPGTTLAPDEAEPGQERSAASLPLASMPGPEPAPTATAVPAAGIVTPPAPAPDPQQADLLPTPPAPDRTAGTLPSGPGPDLAPTPPSLSTPPAGNTAPPAPLPEQVLVSEGAAPDQAPDQGARVLSSAPAPSPAQAPRVGSAPWPAETESASATAPTLPTADHAAVGRVPVDRGASVTLASTPALPLAALPPEEVVGLMRRAKALLALHDISGARRFYERAATNGSGPMRAQAAAALASTYDPARQTTAPWDPQPDTSAALAWYRLAASLGDEESRARAARLESQSP